MSFENPSLEDSSAVDFSEQEPQESLLAGAFEHEEFSFGNGPESIEAAKDAVRKALGKFNWPAGQIEDFALAVGEQIGTASGSKNVELEIYVGEDEIRVAIADEEDVNVSLVEETPSSTSEEKELQPSVDGKAIDKCDEVRFEGGKLVMVRRRRGAEEDDGGWQKLKP